MEMEYSHIFKGPRIMKYNVTSRALVFAALCATCEAVARTGSFAKQPLDATPALGLDFSFFGEGIE